MGSFRTLTVLMTLGTWGLVATEGAPPDGTAPPAGATARPDPPAPPSEYVKAASWLVQTGDNARAAQYVKAADDYRDRLTEADQKTLDELKGRISGAPAASAAPVAAPAPAPAPNVAPQTTTAAPPGGMRTAGPEDKQAAVWLLRQARESIAQGRYDDATQKIAEVRAMNIKWGRFDDTPNMVEKTLQKARPQTTAANQQGTTRGDRSQAKAKLQEARTALNTGQIDQAEAIANEVAAWNQHFNIFEDSPEKVLQAARALRRRDVVRQAGPGYGASQDIYNVLVQEARAAMATGQLDVAEQKATRAQQMNVVPSLTSDRAEAVLHDLAMLKAKSTPGTAPAPAAETASARAEREANQLLAANDKEAAAAKFVEAERLHNQEQTLASLGNTTDPKVVQAQATPTSIPLTPAGAPEAAPAASTPSALGDPFPADLATKPAAVPETQPQLTDPAPGAAAAPAPALTEVPASPQPPSAAPMLTDQPTGTATANPGEGLLQQATNLMAAGNFAEAKKLAEQVRTGNYGVEARANDLLAQIALSAQGGALKIYEAALDALRKQEFDRARSMLAEITSMDVQDEGLQQKVQDLIARIPSEKPGQATLATVTDADAVKAQKLNVEVGTKVAESRRLMETDPDKAIALLQQTLTAVQAADVTETARRTMVRRLEVAVELAKKDKVAFDIKMKDKSARAEIEAKRLRILEADQAKEKQVAELMTKAKEAEAMGNLLEAEQFAKRASEIDPNNIAATALATVSRMKRHYELDKDIEARKNESNLEAFQDVSASGIVPSDVQKRGIAYPKDFSDLVGRRRDQIARLERKKDPADQAVEAKLEEPITLTMDKEQTLGETVNYLSSYTGLNIVVDSKAMQEEGMTLDSPVRFSAKDIKLKAALKFMLSQYNLTYSVQEGVLLITSPQANKHKTIVQAYQVADLVISPHKKQRAAGLPVPGALPGANGLNVPSLNPADTAAPLSGTAPSSAPAAGGWTNQGGDRADRLSNIDFEPLVQLIKASVAPGTWKEGPEEANGERSGGFGLGGGLGGAGGAGTEDQGGQYGSITPFFLNISLIIRHTAEVHDEIVDLLRQLRRMQDMQISIEVRYITVSDSFFEQIGIDFDFAIQSNSVGPKSSFAVPNPAAVPTAPGGGTTGGTTTAVGPYLINPNRDHTYGSKKPLIVGMSGPTNDIGNPTFTNNLMVPFTQDSFDAIAPFNAATSNTGLQTGIAFLSDLEVYLFMQAVQGDTRANIVQAPKVTTFNGAAASVFDVTQRWYVSELMPIVGAGAVAFMPMPAPLMDGVQLYVTPVVSADRRYVRMSLDPVFNVFSEFQTFVVPAAVGGGGLGGGATSINGQIQLPVVATTEITTTVTVPDGGTVLLGGVKRLHEERKEFGVPVLAKVPLIDRLFKNIGIGRTTDSLMLMVTPRIIILEEEEAKLGIPAADVTTY